MRTLLISGLGGLLLLSAALQASAGCGEVGVPDFGNPNTLDRKNLPGEAGAEPLSCGGEGGALSFDGGPCPSFAADIYPYFTATGKWKCADATCHGGSTAPKIEGATAAGALTSLRAVTVAGKPYIASDAGDPAASTLLCNLQGSCGSKMPKPPGADPTGSELCAVEAWLRCGSPP